MKSSIFWNITSVATHVGAHCPYQNTKYATTLTSRLPPATSAPSSPTARLRLTHYARSLTNTPSHFFPVFSLDQQNRPFSGHLKLMFLSPIGSLGDRVRAQWFHSVPRDSLWELRSTLPFPSCFLYNRKFPASRLLGFLPAFTLVSCSVFRP
jgi:hypothetical protein